MDKGAHDSSDLKTLVHVCYLSNDSPAKGWGRALPHADQARNRETG